MQIVQQPSNKNILAKASVAHDISKPPKGPYFLPLRNEAVKHYANDARPAFAAVLKIVLAEHHSAYNK